jgi:hypothetical protein
MGRMLVYVVAVIWAWQVFTKMESIFRALLTLDL